MDCTRRRTAGFVAAGVVMLSAGLGGQVPQSPWRGAGSQPCAGPDGGIFQCPPAPRAIALRAGRLFDSNTGRVLTKQVVLIQGDRIAAVGPDGAVALPAGTQLLDLGSATLIPGLIDAHTHMFNTRAAQMTAETAMLIAVQNAQADLRAGFTTARDMTSHGNGYADVELRNAIDLGRIDGPRLQVSTLGIAWSSTPATAPQNPLAGTVIRSIEEGRAAVQEQINKGADWIKLYPTGGYSFTPNGEPEYVRTYPMPVLQALIDEAHRLGHKTACHVFGGEGQRNAIEAGCDTIEHAFGLTQDQADTIAKGGCSTIRRSSATSSRTWTTTTTRTLAASTAWFRSSRRRSQWRSRLQG